MVPVAPVARTGAAARIPVMRQAEWEVAVRLEARAVVAQAWVAQAVVALPLLTRLPTGTPPPSTFQ